VRVLVVALEGVDGPPNGLNLLVRGTVGALREHHDVVLLAGAPRVGAASTADGATLHVDRPAQGRARTVARWAAARAGGRPWQVEGVERAFRRPLRAAVDDVGPDVVHVISGRLAGLGGDLGSVPRILTAIDAWHLNADAAAAGAGGLRRAALRVEASAVRRFEGSAFDQFDRVAVITDRDRQALAEVAPHLPLVVVPHGVDAERFAPGPDQARRPATIVMHGVLSYPPNVRAARTLVEDVLPLVRAQVPEAAVVLVGRDPSPEVVALAGTPGVSVTGAVDDVQPWLATASVYVCPMSTGGGVKNKVLEAMAAAAPCVVTDIAVQGLAVEPGVDALVAEGPAALASAVVRVLRDPELGRRIGLAGSERVRRAHSWSAVGSAYDALYREVVARGSVDVG
jgi:glycosyltransferase involved in cell wall biosynthesis